MNRILVIGGYGNFGQFICQQLASHAQIQLIIAGRSAEKAQRFARQLNAANPAQAVALDINTQIHESLQQVKPNIVIHTSGPFQNQSYGVAQACIDHQAHYIDLADGREFVAGIDQLDAAAKAKGVCIISGASSVPCLTSALVDAYQSEFSELQSLDYGITTAQKTTRGLATTAAILSYTGKPFSTLIDGQWQDIYGWQSLHARTYSSLGKRWLGNCNVPDLALFPQRYPQLKTIRFYAGLELPLIHFTLWALSGLVRDGLVKHLEKAAPLLLKTAFLFDWFGSADSGFHMELKGIGLNGQPHTRLFELIARDGDGPYIPCMPSILLALKLANEHEPKNPSTSALHPGAQPCLGLISKEEYLAALAHMNITWNAR